MDGFLGWTATSIGVTRVRIGYSVSALARDRALDDAVSRSKYVNLGIPSDHGPLELRGRGCSSRERFRLARAGAVRRALEQGWSSRPKLGHTSDPTASHAFTRERRGSTRAILES